MHTMSAGRPFTLEDLLSPVGGPYHWASVSRTLSAKWAAPFLPQLELPRDIGDVDRLRSLLLSLAVRLDGAELRRPKSADAEIGFAEHLEIVRGALDQIEESFGGRAGLWVRALATRDDQGGSYAWHTIFWRLAQGRFSDTPPPASTQLIEKLVAVFWELGTEPRAGARSTDLERSFNRGASRRARGTDVLGVATDLLRCAAVDRLALVLNHSLSKVDQDGFVEWGQERGRALGMTFESRPTLDRTSVFDGLDGGRPAR